MPVDSLIRGFRSSDEHIPIDLIGKICFGNDDNSFFDFVDRFRKEAEKVG